MSNNTYAIMNGVEMPAPKLEGITFAEEKIWSKNTKRGANGDVVGDIIAIKKTFSIEFPPLKPSDVRRLNSVVSNKNLSFFTVDIYDGEVHLTGMFYAGTPKGKIYSVFLCIFNYGLTIQHCLCYSVHDG